jgi:ankyrin repeat protein
MTMAGLNKEKLPPPSPLARAIGRKDINTVRELLRRGADVNAQEGDGIDALSLTAILGFTEIAQLLIDNGANVNACGSNGATPLMKAINMDKVEMVRLLINNGAEVEATSTEGYTPLMYAVLRNNIGAVRLLLGRDADVSRCERRGHNAQGLAEAWKRKEIIPLLKDAYERQQHCGILRKQQRLNKITRPVRIIKGPAA